MTNLEKPVVNPSIVLREEFDDWAILFDPDSGEAFGLDPVGVFIWKKFDGKHTLEKIQSELKKNCEGEVPTEASEHIKTFAEDLLKRGFIGCAKDFKV